MHFSRKLYMDAKNEGYKFFVRQHIPNAIDAVGTNHKLKSKKEMWDLPFIKRWEGNIVGKDIVIPKDHAEAFDRWEIEDCIDDGEQLLMAHLNNQSFWVVAYLMDLEKFEIEVCND